MTIQATIPLPKPLPRPPETVLVNVIPQETRVAVMCHNEVCEIHMERSRGRSLVGNIYLGVVNRVLPGMQSAFVDIGLERSAFLHIVDTVEQHHRPNEQPRIETLVYEGQIILVQVLKDPIGNKGARVSTQISLPGRFLVHLPQDEHIGISQRIDDEKERERLKSLLASLLTDDCERGYIIRTGADGVSEPEIKADQNYLHQLWKNIEQQSKTQPAPCLIHQDLPLYLRLLRDFLTPEIKQMVVDNQAVYEQMCEFANRYIPQAKNKIILHQEVKPLFEFYNVDDAMERALYPRVNLRGGGYVIIEPTEAMTTIDVNTGGFVGRHNFDETVLKTNLEACSVIARELRLRNIGGMVLIDFIDMMQDSHRDLVLAELAQCLSQDRTRVTLNGFTSLGLVEITRKRTRESLYHMLTQSCPYCHGRGYMKTIQTVCYEIFRSLQRESQYISPANTYRVLASPALVEMLIDEASEAWIHLQQELGKPISLTAESSYTQEQFDIILD